LVAFFGSEFCFFGIVFGIIPGLINVDSIVSILGIGVVSGIAFFLIFSLIFFLVVGLVVSANLSMINLVPTFRILAEGIKKPLEFIERSWKEIRIPLSAFIVIYFTIAFLFGCLYGTVYHWEPTTSFTFTGEDKLDFVDLCYFSLVTITTLGYGDIEPLNKTTRLLASLEVTVGIGLVVVYFAFLVMYFQSRINSPRNGEDG